MFIGIGKDLRDEFLNASDWTRKKSKKPTLILQRPNGQFLTLHSRTSPYEDFATSIEYYLFDTAKLKRTIPKVHAWIEKRLGDRLKMRIENE